MSSVDNVVSLLQVPWIGHAGAPLSIAPLPPLRSEVISALESHWTGILTPEMRQVLQTSCGMFDTPLGSIDFTGRWYPEEPLSVFRSSLTLSIDSDGRRWIAETGKRRGLPGPVWCVFSRPEVALFVDRDLANFITRLYDNVRSGTTARWLTTLNTRARLLWASRYARAIGLPVAFTRLRELRGWLGGLPLDAWVYDLRAPGVRRGLPYGLAGEHGDLCRCGRLPVFAFLGAAAETEDALERTLIRPAGRDLSSSRSSS